MNPKKNARILVLLLTGVAALTQTAESSPVFTTPPVQHFFNRYECKTGDQSQ